MNQMTLAGHLGADPEVRFTSSGKKVTTLRVATRSRRGQKDETIWWRVTIWGEQFDNVIPYFKKGSPIIVVGELSKPEIFTDRDGRPQVSMNVTAYHIMFSPFGRPDHGGTHEGGEAHGHAQAHGETAPREMAMAAQEMPGQGRVDVSSANLDDEIPF